MANRHFRNDCPKCNSYISMTLMTMPTHDYMECVCLNCGFGFQQQTADYDIRARFKNLEKKYEYPEDRTVRKAREAKRIKDPRKPKKSRNPWLDPFAIFSSNFGGN
jgi:Zn ribbon nucleic-acid-binding protein